jgi:hypothetical protein
MKCILFISKNPCSAVVLSIFKSLVRRSHSQWFLVFNFVHLSRTHLLLIGLIMQLYHFILNLSAFRLKIILAVECKPCLVQKRSYSLIVWCLTLIVHEWSTCDIECLIHLKQLTSLELFFYKIFRLLYYILLYHLFFNIKR